MSRMDVDCIINKPLKHLLTTDSNLLAHEMGRSVDTENITETTNTKGKKK